MKRYLKIKSLKKKIILFILIITVLCIAGSAFMASQVVEKQTVDKYEADKEAAIVVLSYSLAPIIDLYDYEQVERTIRSSLSYANIASVAVFDGSGTLIRSVAEQNVSPEDLDMKKRNITIKGKQIGSVEIGFSKEYINKRIRTMTVALIFGLIGVFVLVGFGLYAFVSRFIIEPLENFTETVKEMSSENLSARVKILREDEIGILAASFNQMAENLEESHKILLESEEKYRGFFKASKDVVYMSTRDGKLLDMNDYGLELFGIKRDDLDKIDIAGDIYADPDDRAAFAEILDREGYATSYEVNLKRIDGTVFPAINTAVTVKDADENVTGYQGIIRDITKRKQAEEALQKAHHGLGAKVEERTKNLKDKTEKLERMNKLFVDRELRMKELKEEIKNLKRKM